MGFSEYTLSDGRRAGYAVDAQCDHPDCHAEIHRGLAYLCGTYPNCGEDVDAVGCGDYFCYDHRYLHHCPTDAVDGGGS